MEKKELRKADFITSVLLLLFSMWMLIETFKMPMKDTFGGVQNVWYVSPALFPLIISIFIFILGIVLFTHSIKSGGAKYFLDSISERNKFFSDKNIRFLSILLALLFFVYLDIPRIDFFISTLLFLIFFIPIFYFDEMQLLRKLTLFYFIGNIVLIFIFITRLSTFLNSYYKYSIDLIALSFFLIYGIYIWTNIKNNHVFLKKYIISLLVTIAVPLILCPIFRFFLLVPLPREGFIIQIMYNIYYLIK